VYYTRRVPVLHSLSLQQTPRITAGNMFHPRGQATEYRCWPNKRSQRLQKSFNKRVCYFCQRLLFQQTLQKM